VGGSTEPVQAEARCIPRQHECAVADQPSAEKRRDLEVGVPLWELEAVPLIGHRLFRKTAIDLVAGEAGSIAEVLPSRAAEATGAIRPAEPGHADTLPDREARRTLADPAHQSHDLMTKHERQLRVRQLAVGDV